MSYYWDVIRKVEKAQEMGKEENGQMSNRKMTLFK